MPETIKKLCVEEPSTISMITELNNVINNYSLSFNDLIEQLNIHLRHVIMGMKVFNLFNLWFVLNIFFSIIIFYIHAIL